MTPLRFIIPSACLSTTLAAQTPSGEEVYKQRCAGCHSQDNPRIPPRTSLEKMPASHILRTLNYGAMLPVAYTMSMAEREAVAKYLGVAGGDAPMPASAFCRDRAVKIAANPKVQWNGWSPTAENWRYQTAEAAGLTLDGVKRLKLKWAFALAGDVTAFAQPTILDNDLFMGSAGGMIHALDRDTGCIRWLYQADGPVRAAIVAVREGGRYVLPVRRPDRLVLFARRRLRQAALEETHGGSRRRASHRCGRGLSRHCVRAGRRMGGEPRQRPQVSMLHDARQRGCLAHPRRLASLENLYDGSAQADRRQRRGHAHLRSFRRGHLVGAHSRPERGLLYAATGDNYSQPANELSDAVVALDLRTGKIKWSRQFTAGDAFTGACAGKPGCGPDFDFGSSTMLVKSGNRTVLVAGQKSGVVYGLDPDRQGEILWQLRVGKGGTNGGVEWGMATDGQNVYAAVSDVARAPRTRTDLADLRDRELDPNVGGDLTAIRLSDGSKAWYAAAQPCSPPKPGCSPAQPGAVTAIPGAVFSGSVDGHLRAFSSEDGKVLWDFDTAHEFQTVNGIKGQGGSVEGPGAVIVKGMVFVNSGYLRQAEMQGNVLLAFTTE